MTKLRLVLLATTALTAMQLPARPIARADRAAGRGAGPKEELGPDGKPKQPPPPAAAASEASASCCRATTPARAASAASRTRRRPTPPPPPPAAAPPRPTPPPAAAPPPRPTPPPPPAVRRHRVPHRHHRLLPRLRRRVRRCRLPPPRRRQCRRSQRRRRVPRLRYNHCRRARRVRCRRHPRCQAARPSGASTWRRGTPGRRSRGDATAAARGRRPGSTPYRPSSRHSGAERRPDRAAARRRAVSASSAAADDCSADSDCAAVRSGPDPDCAWRGAAGTAPHGRFPWSTAGKRSRRPQGLHRTRPCHRCRSLRSVVHSPQRRGPIPFRRARYPDPAGRRRNPYHRDSSRWLGDHHRHRPRRPVAAPDSPGSAGPRDHHHRQHLSRPARGRRILCRPAAAGDPHSL